MSNINTSIIEMARGAIMERVDLETARVVDNIADINTKATAKRKITITIEFVPDDTRQNIQVSATAKSTLAPTVLDMSGVEQEQPKILKLVSSFEN